MPDVSVEHADTYKCYARNEYGKAIVTAALNVIEGQLLFYYIIHKLKKKKKLLQ